MMIKGTCKKVLFLYSNGKFIVTPSADALFYRA